MSGLLREPIDVLLQFKKNTDSKDSTFISWVAADLCAPLGDVIQQNLNLGHAVSEEDSLEHPITCYQHLLKPNPVSFIMIKSELLNCVIHK